MAKSAYEYGKRWNTQLPRNDIRFLVRRIHSATSDEKVSGEILARCQTSGIPERMWPACARYALCVHHAQKRLYHAVLRGNFRGNFL